MEAKSRNVRWPHGISLSLWLFLKWPSRWIYRWKKEYALKDFGEKFVLRNVRNFCLNRSSFEKYFRRRFVWATFYHYLEILSAKRQHANLLWLKRLPDVPLKTNTNLILGRESLSYEVSNSELFGHSRKTRMVPKDLVKQIQNALKSKQSVQVWVGSKLSRIQRDKGKDYLRHNFGGLKDSAR